MQVPLSSIAGIGLACACHLVVAAPSITITQQGNGNTTSAEQSDLSNYDISVTITQIGNNNHVGGPGTIGVVQHGPVLGMGTTLLIYQNGTNNNAGIVQGTVYEFAVGGSIEQTGSGNSATVRQEAVNGPLIEVKQNGSGNRSDVKQVAVLDSTIWTTQNGIGNSVVFSEHNSGPFFGSPVVQNGEGNMASVTAEQAAVGSPVIQQNGYRNDARASQTDTDESVMQFLQQGSANLADAAQTGFGHSIGIDQNGSGNAARVTQSGSPDIFTGNSAVIAQVGNGNNATVRQQGVVYAANLNQTGSGNWTSVYQH